MKMHLIRTSKQESLTTGVLYVEGHLLCHTLEPTRRNLPKEQKVKGKTAIPEGTYEIRLLTSPKFRRKMPYLMNVPHFTGIMIHCGNSVEDTHGCILVGERSEYGPGSLTNSRPTFTKLYKMLEMAIGAGDKISITIE